MRSGDGRQRSEYLLHEANLRTMLTNMYNALRSIENSRKIIEKSPDKIDHDEYCGDELEKNSMKGLCEWMSAISALAKDDATYRSVFLDPVRVVANMRLELSRMRIRSTHVDALVFAQMPYYDTEHNVQRTLMSTVVPSLQASMSVRVSTGNNPPVSHGYHVFENCQPIPLVNRIHQTSGTMQRSERGIDLSEFDCLYAALDDVASLGRSLEMENFCEVPSPDAEPRRRLAAPFVTFGTVEMVSGPAVHVKSLDGESRVKMIAANQVSDLSGEPHCNFECKTARILGAQWYEPAKDRDSVPENPALYCIEADDDLDALLLQEACGRVRLRGSVSADEIPGGMRGRLLGLRCISATQGRVSYARSRAHDEVSAHFCDAHDRICRARTKLNAVQITEDQVIDRQKSGINGFACMLTSPKYRVLGGLLMDFVMQTDTSAEYSEDQAARSHGLEPGRYDGKMSRLRSFGIIEKADDGWRLTGKGRDVAKAVGKRMATRIPKAGLPAVLSPDALTEHRIPPSLALALLRSGALGEYRPARIGGQTTNLYWVGRRLEWTGEPDRMLEVLKRKVLGAMGSVSHPSTAAGIADSVQASAFTTELLLSEMSAGADSPVRRDGGSWDYTVTARVQDLFERERMEIMSEDDVAARIVVGTARKAEVRQAIESLVRAGVVARVEDGAFSHNSDLESKRGARMDRRVEDAAMEALSSQDGMDDDSMIDGLVRILDDAGVEWDAQGKIECARRVLNRMEDDGRICRNGSRILKPAP